MQAVRAGTVSYSYPQIQGVVVDDATNRPVAGVAIIGIWAGKPVFILPFHALRIVEVLSDANDRFVIPAWSSTTLETVVIQPFPLVTSYAHGFRQAVADAKQLQAQSAELRLRLKPIADSPADRARELRDAMHALLFAWTPLPKEPPPQMLTALDYDWQSLPQEVKGGMAKLTGAFAGGLQELRTAFEQWSLAQ